MNKENSKFMLQIDYINNLKNNQVHKLVQDEGALKIDLNNNSCFVFSYGLAAILTDRSIPSTKQGSGKEFLIDGTTYINPFFEGFKEGKKYFINNFKNNTYQSKDTIVNTIKRFYYDEILDGNIGWRGFTHENTPAILSESIVKKWGYYNGVVYELKQFIILNKELFESFYIQSDNEKQTRHTSSERPNRTDLALFIYYLSETKYNILNSQFPSESAWKELASTYNRHWKNIQQKYLEIHNDRNERLKESKKKNIKYLIDNMLIKYPKALELAKRELNSI